MRYNELIVLVESNEDKLMKVRRLVIDTIRPNRTDLWGFCGIICVGVWDEMNKPNNLIPYSVMYGEEEHVILYDRSQDWAFDPTVDQFGEKEYFVNEAKSKFKRFHKLSTSELDSLRVEGVAYLNRIQKK